MKHLLGGKGAGLAEMTNLKIPVPAGFTITTEVCKDFFRNNKKYPPGMWDEVLANLRKVEKAMGMKLGDKEQSSSCFRPVRGQVLDARHDGHGAEPRA